MNSTIQTGNIKEVRLRAKEIRKKYGLIGAAVDPLDIAKELGIKVYEQENLKTKDGQSVSGAIIKNNDEVRILINSGESSRRQRFTIAHELGHYFLGHLDSEKGQYIDLARNSLTSKSPKEADAEEFASSLLMDEDEVKERYKMTASIGMSNSQVINLLSDIFVVSKAAAYTRLSNLGLI